MSIKIILRPWTDQFLTLSSPTTIPSESFKSNLIKSSSLSPKRIRPIDLNSEFTINYMNQNPSSNIASSISVKILYLKIYISDYVNIKPDSLNLFVFSPVPIEKFIQLNDKDNYILINDQNGNFNQQSKQSSFRSGDSKQNVLYFKIVKEKHKVVIDVFQYKIEKIIIDISLSCSIYMLKHLINTKLSSNIPSNEISIYGVGYVNIDNYIRRSNALTKAISNKKFHDNTLIEEIILYYSIEGLDLANSILNLILIKKSQKECKMGLDFRFNYLHNFIKIDFNHSAPSYRESSDGLNLFIYCTNPGCEIGFQYYVVKIGYGEFDLMEEIKSIKCPKCNKIKKELKNIGFIKTKWKYKGLLKHKKDSKVEGDGITVDNKLYVISEILFQSQFQILLIETEPYMPNDFIHCSNSNNGYDNGYDDESSSELNDISLCLPDANKFNNNQIDNVSSYLHINSNEKKAQYIGFDNVNMIKDECDIVIEGKNAVKCNDCFMFSISHLNNNCSDKQKSSTCIII